MRLRLRAHHLLLAALAVNALLVGNAFGTASGHFTSSSSHAIVKGYEKGPSHKLEFSVSSVSTKIVCNSTSYSGTLASATATQFALAPSLSACEATSGGAVTVTTGGCEFLLTSGPNTGGDNTVHLTCPAGQRIEIHASNCTMRIQPQTPGGGVTYATVTENGKHSLTVGATLSVSTQFEGGVCIFLGTNQTGALEGAATLIGTDTEGNPLDLTATG